MLAILYLILCLVYGISLISLCIPDVRRLYAACSPSKKTVSKIPAYIFVVPAGSVIGMILVATFNYYLTLALSHGMHNGDFCKRLSVLITFAVFVVLIATNLMLCLKRDPSSKENSSLPEYKNTIGNTLYYGICTVVFTVASAFLCRISFLRTAIHQRSGGRKGRRSADSRGVRCRPFGFGTDGLCFH